MSLYTILNIIIMHLSFTYHFIELNDQSFVVHIRHVHVVLYPDVRVRGVITYPCKGTRRVLKHQ